MKYLLIGLLFALAGCSRRPLDYACTNHTLYVPVNPGAKIVHYRKAKRYEVMPNPCARKPEHRY